MKIPAVLKYSLFNVLRAKWLVLYAIFFGLFTSALLQFGADSDKVAATLSNIILFIVPMVSILYASIYWYNSEAFVSLLLTQPLKRSSVYLSTWLAISSGLAGSFTVATVIPLLGHSSLDLKSGLLVFFGCLLSFIFVGLGMLIATLVADRMMGIGVTFLVWLYLAVLHDALVFLTVSTLRDYPIEIPSMLLMAINPIDLARVTLLLSLDLPAMMGYTGKILQSSLSGMSGLILTGTALFIWMTFATGMGLRLFLRKDL